MKFSTILSSIFALLSVGSIAAPIAETVAPGPTTPEEKAMLKALVAENILPDTYDGPGWVTRK